MANKEHYSFVGTLADSISDPCVNAMVIGGVLINRNTKAVYIRTTFSVPAVVGDWTLLGSGGGGGGDDIYVVDTTLNPITNVLTLIRNDNATITEDLSPIKVPPTAANIVFNNSGTNFGSTNVQTALIELNTNRPFAKMPFGQNTATTNKPLNLGDAIHHSGKLYVGTTTEDRAKVSIHGALKSGWGNEITDVGTGAEVSSTIGGMDNVISYASNSSYEGSAGSFIIGGRTNVVNGPHMALMSAFDSAVAGDSHTIISSSLINIAGNGNFIANSTGTDISGVNNTIFNTSDSLIVGSSNVIMSGRAFISFNSANQNIINYAENLAIANANRNIVLKSIGGEVYSDDNLLWGLNLYAHGGTNTEVRNILLGQNIKTSGTDAFVWSGRGPSSSPSITGVVVTHTGVAALVGGATTVSADFASATNNEFMALFPGGYRFRTNEAGTVGVNLAASANSWSSVSSIKVKDVVQDELDINTLIERFKDLKFKIYKYKDGTVNFLSTTAEEWQGLMKDFTTESWSNTNGELLLSIPNSDQSNLALLFIQDIYSKFAKLSDDLILLTLKLNEKGI